MTAIFTGIVPLEEPYVISRTGSRVPAVYNLSRTEVPGTITETTVSRYTDGQDAVVADPVTATNVQLAERPSRVATRSGDTSRRV